ncbi:MAG: hypothetical protein A3I05_00865 [Deltaproteobacteria bacterium RIFCSPLOWO2_02_FULL_44_10]|nr:MAG: hypothetical protein A3C46_06540 [Deltaproteobacteria bacterium RIFCSPHIGHO2_02_FULL_44_16]OGQ45307.1 MAG: hypothetical protein A3I05_00865 [Deltaproteobacteria bacterium RIFCSPLOWO2_02_FULL_44_10]
MVFVSTQRRRIGLFGGSFDPPHLGHVEICKRLLLRNQVDEIWIIPCFLHPFGKPILPYEHRKTMCHFAFDPLGKRVAISNVEMELGGVSHTIRTIMHLKRTHPEYAFSLIVGEDNEEQLREWFHFEEMKRIIPIILIPRGNDSPISDISSSDIRERMTKGESIAELVPMSVAVYMITHALYR